MRPLRESIRHRANDTVARCREAVAFHGKKEKLWSRIFYCLNILAIILSTIGSIIIANASSIQAAQPITVSAPHRGFLNGTIIATILVSTSAGVIAFSTLLDPKATSKDHMIARVEFHNLSMKAERLSQVNVENTKLTDDDLRHEIEVLDSDYQALVVRHKPEIADNRGTARDEKVMILSSVSHLYLTMADLILKANSSVDDITWGTSAGTYATTQDNDAYKTYLASRKQALEHNSNLRYREVSCVPNKHFLSRALDLFNYFNYQLGYFEKTPNTPPISPYLIVDDESVFIGFHDVKSFTVPAEKQMYALVTEPVVAKFFSDHFEEMYRRSEKVKESDTIDKALLQKIAGSVGAKLNGLVLEN